MPEAKTVKNRLHLDVRVGAGARRLRLLLADEENEACLVRQDVQGNEFCLD